VREEAERKPVTPSWKKAKDKQRQYELEKTKLAFEHELERAKYTLQQRQEEEREKHRSELEKFERQMQFREKGCAIPPQQIQIDVTRRETEDEAADSI